MLRKLCILGIGSTLLAGCFATNTSQAPIATTYPLTEQQKMQAAHHWNVLAQHEAGQLLSAPVLQNKVLYIDGSDQKTPFSQTFSSLLTSELVAGGARVQTDATHATRISYKVQLIEHKDRGKIRAPQGALTTLAAGIAVATIPYNHWSEPSLALIPLAAATDLFSGSWTSESNQEVVITTQAIQGNQILYSSSNIYYINGGDSDHYVDQTAGKTVNVTNNW